MQKPHEAPVAVIGLGYVGNVVAASLAASGRRVIGVDRRIEVNRNFPHMPS